jgi:hypothetical protein
MKAYDCALIRLEQAFDALCRPTAHSPCAHVHSILYPIEDVILMSYSEPHSMLINMPTMNFCTQCGQCLSCSWRPLGDGRDHSIGYSERIL